MTLTIHESSGWLNFRVLLRARAPLAPLFPSPTVAATVLSVDALSLSVLSLVIVNCDYTLSATQSSRKINMNQSSRCPGTSTFQCSGPNKTDLDIGIAPAWVSIVSSFVACLMAPLILIAYAAFEEMRKSTAQKLVTLIALADTLAAVAFIIGGVNYLVHYKADYGCKDFQKICATQSFLVIWSSNATYILTPILTFHYLLIFSRNFHWGRP